MSKKMLGDLMRQAQKMQEEMMKTQEEAKKKTAEATAGGGMVTVVASGSGELVSIKIEKDVVNPEDIEMLQDLILAASNEALRRAQEIVNEEMSRLTGGMQIPGLAYYGGYFGVGLYQSAQIGVTLGTAFGAACAAEGHQRSLGKRKLTCLSEKLNISGGSPWPTGLYVMDTQLVQRADNLQLIIHREGYAFSLSAITQCGIVQVNLSHPTLPATRSAIFLVPTLVLPGSIIS